MFQLIIKLLVIYSVNYVMAAKILAVFPTPSISHQNVYKTILKELARRGHEITYVTTDPFPKGQEQRNINEINFHELSYRIWRKYNSIISSDHNSDVGFKMSVAFNGINDVFEQQLKTAEMRKLMEEKHSYFDLLLLEACVIPILSLSHIFKAPVILISSFGAVLGNYEIVGAPTHPFLYPTNFRRRIYNLTFWEKVTELITHTKMELVSRSSEKNADTMLQNQLGDDFPSLNELKNNVHMLFLNINSIWAGNHPVPSNVVFMGGILPNITEELSQDLQSVLDKSINGVIYVSFGSNIKPSLLPPMKILILLNALSEIPYDILLKWDVDRLPGAPKNIRIFKWLPQSSLLKHPKIKLFITQGGLQSTDEAINAGVPLIGIPMFSDQWYNTEKYIHFQIGMQIDMKSLTEETLKNAIYSVIRDKSYRSNIIELRNLMQDQPQTPLDRCVWWTEHVLRHGGAKHLRSPTANMSWADYLELNFVLTLFFMLFIALVLLILFLISLCRFILNSFNDMKKKLN